MLGEVFRGAELRLAAFWCALATLSDGFVFSFFGDEVIGDEFGDLLGIFAFVGDLI